VSLVGATSAAAPPVILRGVSVTRGRREVVRGLDAEIPSGSIVGLLGPSGCGKSTLMRAIIGTQEHVRGTIEVLGGPAGTASRQGRVGYMTQAPSVYEDLTVRENLAYFGQLLGVERDGVHDVIAAVKLDDKADSLLANLSGGQRARVSLAIALLGNPPVLVLDEPTVGLDPVLRQELWADFRTYADQGRTLIVSSHVMDEAEHCDVILLMRDGVLLAQGSPQDLRARTGTGSIEAAFVAIVTAGESR
jgi:ABC-type multidrug transport system ATPase subunit